MESKVVATYQCNVCDRNFTTINALHKHLSEHRLDQLHICRECGKPFKEEAALEKHKQEHKIKACSLSRSVIKTYKCHVCKSLFSALKDLRQHLQKCQECGKPFEGANLNKHENEHKSQAVSMKVDTTYPYNVCNKTFPSKATLDLHLPEHGAADREKRENAAIKVDTAYRCFICNNIFPTILALHNHFPEHEVFFSRECGKPFKEAADRSKHEDEHKLEVAAKFACEICSKSFLWPGQLIIHKWIHTDNKPRKYRKKGNEFVAPTSLEQHLKKHKAERRYVCEICGKACFSIYTLKNHIRTHTNEKPFQCSICKKSFISKSSLQSHEQVHAGGGRLRCHVCDKTFLKKRSLTNHMKLHSGKALYNCDKCGKQFKVLRSLRQHKEKPMCGKIKPYECGECGKTFLHSLGLKKHDRVHNKCNDKM